MSLEAILEAPWHRLQVAAPACTIPFSPEGFDGPVVPANTSRWVAAGGTGLLLNVEASLATPSADSVRLVVPEAERPRSLSALTHGSCLLDTDEKDATRNGWD